MRLRVNWSEHERGRQANRVLAGAWPDFSQFRSLGMPPDATDRRKGPGYPHAIGAWIASGKALNNLLASNGFRDFGHERFAIGKALLDAQHFAGEARVKSAT